MRIFQRNHLLDFVKISKYFKVRSGWEEIRPSGSCPYARFKRICGSRMLQRNDLLDFENFLKKCPTKRPADQGISQPAGREKLADCGSSSVITFWTLPKFQNMSKSAVGRDAPMKVSRLAGRERLADCGSSSVITFLNFVKISKYFKVPSGKRRAHEGLSTGRSRTTRRLRIFQRNHLLDFVKISKYFKVRSGKRFAHRVLVPMLGPNGSADRGCSSVITFRTFKIF